MQRDLRYIIAIKQEENIILKKTTYKNQYKILGNENRFDHIISSIKFEDKVEGIYQNLKLNSWG